LGGLRQLPSNVTAWHREKLQGAEFPQNAADVDELFAEEQEHRGVVQTESDD
jgi:hypothetical protein